MANIKRLLLTAAIVGIATTAYLAGSRTATSEPSKPAAPPMPLKALPADFTIDNPTAVLLGEAKVPLEVLKTPAPSEPHGLIVPVIDK